MVARHRSRNRVRALAGADPMTIKLAYSRQETCDQLSIGLTKLHELINSNALETLKIGRRTLVKGESLRRLIEQGA